MIVLLALGLFKLVVRVGAIIPDAHLDDPEPYAEYTTPKDYLDWWRQTSQAQHTGYLFAGRTEFPWIVDIRQIDLDQEQWSTGNLLTYLHVITSCRSIGEWVYRIPVNDKALCINKTLADGVNEVDANVKCGPDNINASTPAPWWRLHFEYYKGLKVSYAPIYLWEDYKYKRWDEYEPFITRRRYPNITKINKKKPNLTAEDEADLAYLESYLAVRRESDESGSRNAIKLFVHHLCTADSVEYDIGVIKLQKGIWPVTNVIKVMPVNLDRQNSAIPNVDMKFMEIQRRVCYIASWGRSYFNWFHHMVIDYKVKYRVYHAPLVQSCGADLQVKEFQRVHESKRVQVVNDGVFSKRIWCFKTRQKIGAVCDHDRGAPLVCDGNVYGFVVRGVDLKHCSNLVGQPFVVMRVSEISEYWEDITQNALNPKYVNDDFLSSYRAYEPPLPQSPGDPPGDDEPDEEEKPKSLGTYNMTPLMFVRLCFYALLFNALIKYGLLR